MINDFDRLYNAEVNVAHPVAYAMKGPSMNGSTFRNMMELVISESEKRGMSFLATSSDGQWHKYGVRDHNNRPLTMLQIQKGHWKAITSMDKKTILCKVKGICKVTTLDDIDYEKSLEGPLVMNKHKTDRPITESLRKTQRKGIFVNDTGVTGREQLSYSSIPGDGLDDDEVVSTSSITKDVCMSLLVDDLDVDDYVMRDIEQVIESSTLSKGTSDYTRERMTGENEGIFELDSWIFQTNELTANDREHRTDAIYGTENVVYDEP